MGSSTANGAASLVLFFPDMLLVCLAGCLSACIHRAYLVLCCNFLLPGCLLWANNYVFACLVVMLLTYLVRCLYILSECCNTLYTAVSYYILVCLYLGRRKVKINYILINAFLIHRCYMWLLWLWQICEKEKKKCWQSWTLVFIASRELILHHCTRSWARRRPSNSFLFVIP